MNKEQTFELLEKNLKDWKETKESGKPCIENFFVYHMCFSQSILKLKTEETLTDEEEERLKSIEEEIERIKEMPANYIKV